MSEELQDVTIGAGAAESSAFSLWPLIGDAGLVGVPSVWTAAAIGFKVSTEQAGTFVPLRSETGAIVEITGVQAAAAAWYKLPDALKGAMWVKLWSQTAGVDTNQAAARSLQVMAKG